MDIRNSGCSIRSLYRWQEYDGFPRLFLNNRNCFTVCIRVYWEDFPSVGSCFTHPDKDSIVTESEGSFSLFQYVSNRCRIYSSLWYLYPRERFILIKLSISGARTLWKEEFIEGLLSMGYSGSLMIKGTWKAFLHPATDKGSGF